MKKKGIAALLACTMVMTSLTGCGGGSKEVSQAASQSSTSEQSTGSQTSGETTNTTTDLVTEDGNIYSLPNVGADLHAQYNMKLWINTTLMWFAARRWRRLLLFCRKIFSVRKLFFPVF